MVSGHSNVHRLDETAPLITNPERAMVPIVGGESLDSVRELPPLALDRLEWEEIGARMGWVQGHPRRTSRGITSVRSHLRKRSRNGFEVPRSEREVRRLQRDYSLDRPEF